MLHPNYIVYRYDIYISLSGYICLLTIFKFYRPNWTARIIRKCACQCTFEIQINICIDIATVFNFQYSLEDVWIRSARSHLYILS